jgi:hypothetical protein
MFFNIYSEQLAFEFLSEFTGVSIERIQKYVNQENKKTESDFSGEKYLKTFFDDCEQIDTNNLNLCAAHYTTNPDECLSVKTFGLLGLSTALSKDTPLRRFLEERDVFFDFDSKLLRVKDYIYDIKYDREEKNSYLKSVMRRVINDNHVDCFFFIDNVKNYSSCISEYPEILHTLGDLVSCQTYLCDSWKNQSKCYKIEFHAPLADFDSSVFPDYKNSYIKLIELALKRIADDGFYDFIARIKPGKVIPPSQITNISKIDC